ncbi:MAG TPA: DUF4349 domain-containing protein [Gemmatimonadaceae bacterium]|nr:DUF4349 domain-containing protein [Gemmatimonadaceae bacterium]
MCSFYPPVIMRILSLFLVLLISTAACSGDGRDSSGRGSAGEEVVFTDAASPAPEPAPPRAKTAPDAVSAVSQAPGTTTAARPGGASPAVGVAPSMLIRTGTASVEVRDVPAAIVAVRQLASSLGGYVANTSVQSGREQVRSATLELKIPAPQFDRAVNGLEPLGRVEFVNVDAQDVGEEFVDVTARVANARRLEQRLIALLETRTGRLEDVLAVERELARVREEIERFEGRLRYLSTRVSVSTLTVTVHEPQPVLGRGRNPIVDAFRDAWRNFVDFIAWLIAASGVLVPAVALVALAYLGWRRLRGRVRRE